MAAGRAGVQFIGLPSRYLHRNHIWVKGEHLKRKVDTEDPLSYAV
jgi:hypothetical protein